MPPLSLAASAFLPPGQAHHSAPNACSNPLQKAPRRAYPDSDAKTDNLAHAPDTFDITGCEDLEPQLRLRCPTWAMLGHCEDGHSIAVPLICNRDWCPNCGGKDGQAHNRRLASWWSKARQIRSLGYLSITVPPEARWRLRDKRQMNHMATSIRRMLQRRGYKRGMYAWHYFGEPPTDGSRPAYHPHLNILVSAGFIRPKALAELKRSIGRLMAIPHRRVVLHYSYATDVPRMVNKVRYVLRPTFLDPAWDEPMAHELRGHRRRSTWGKWKEPAFWPEQATPAAVRPLARLAAKTCPECEAPLRYTGLRNANLLTGWRLKPHGWWLFHPPDHVPRPPRADEIPEIHPPMRWIPRQQSR